MVSATARIGRENVGPMVSRGIHNCISASRRRAQAHVLGLLVLLTIGGLAVAAVEKYQAIAPSRSGHAATRGHGIRARSGDASAPTLGDDRPKMNELWNISPNATSSAATWRARAFEKRPAPRGTGPPAAPFGPGPLGLALPVAFRPGRRHRPHHDRRKHVAYHQPRPGRRRRRPRPRRRA